MYEKESDMQKEQGIERDIRRLTRYMGVLARRAIREERRNQEFARFWHRLIHNALFYIAILLAGAVIHRIYISF